MGMPSISITFTELAATAIKRGERGIIAMILKDTTVPDTNPAVCVSNEDVPATLTKDNQEQIKLALMGYVNTPKRVIAYILKDNAEDYTEALNYFKTVRFDYLVVPTVETDEKKDDIVSYVKTQRAAKKLIKAVLPNTVGDNEAIINFATQFMKKNDKTYTTEQYCSRIAGVIAGTPLTMSCTYAPLSELTDCQRLTQEEMDAAEEAGKFIVWWDGEKVKTGRGVNSFTTLTNLKNTQFQKVKIVEAMDMISNDIRMTVEDSYIGKYANTYDNKCLLISAIGNYFDQLIQADVIQSYTLGIDIDMNRMYLKGRGKDVDSMTEFKVKTANTGSYVYLICKAYLLDAIEDVVFRISI